MSKSPPTAKKTYPFSAEKLWKVRLNKVDRRQGFLIRQFRAFSLAAKGFGEDNCLVAATALTYYTLFSIVPVLALAFAIAKGFGFEKQLQAQIMHNYVEYSDILSNAFIYANKLLQNAQGGIIAGIGVVLLLWSVMQLLTNIEATFNRIWEVKRGRSWIRKLTDYLTIMLLGPIFFILSTGITVALQTRVESMEYVGVVGAVFLKLFAYALLAGIFAFLYMALPNTKVKYRPAIYAAILSTLVFELLGWGYVNFQIGANRLNAIYGTLAALPLFLIWVQYCWYIVLFGAELTYAYQNVDHYELNDDVQNLSLRYRKVIALLIAGMVARRFYNQEKAPTVNEISDQLDIPSRLARTLVNEFVDSGVLAEVKTENEKDLVYLPAITESRFTVKSVLDALEKKGLNELPIADEKEQLRISELMTELDRSLDSDIGHTLVKDIAR